MGRTNLGEESVKVLRLGETVLANNDVLHGECVWWGFLEKRDICTVSKDVVISSQR